MSLPSPDTATFRLLCSILADQNGLIDWDQCAETDWRLFGNQALRHGIAPLVYWKLKERGWIEQFPPSTVAALQREYYRVSAQNSLLLQELDRVLLALTQARVPVILLKGAHLARTLYPSPALRPFNDLDVLAHQANIPGIVDLLAQLGFQDTEAKQYPPGSLLDQMISRDILLNGGPGGQVALELHWRLIGPEFDIRSPSLDVFWQTGQPVDQKNPTLMHLSPEANLLYLSAHLALQHGFLSARLIWLYDLFLILSRCQIDWHLVVALARQLNWADPLFVCLVAVQDYFGLVLPPSALESLRCASDPRTADLVRRKALSSGSHAVDIWSHWERSGWSAKTRIRMAVAELFPTPSYMRSRYKIRPTYIWPFYYPYRWWGIAVDLVKGLLKHRTRFGAG
jgi:hypothetical protein